MRLIGLAVVLTVSLALAPLAVEAQQSGKVWRIGSLNTGPIPVPGRIDPTWLAFLQRLRELGYVEGQNLSIEYRSSGGPVDPLPALATELVRLNVDVIVVPSTQPALAAKQATTKIPIVMGAASDVLETGLVKSLARPGGNITGLTVSGSELSRKRLELLKAAIPKISRVADLADPTNPTHEIFWSATQGAAQTLGVMVQRRSAQIRTDQSEPVEEVAADFVLGEAPDFTRPHLHPTNRPPFLLGHRVVDLGHGVEGQEQRARCRVREVVLFARRMIDLPGAPRETQELGFKLRMIE